MLFRETVAVYCENRIEYTDTLCGHDAGFGYVKSDGTCSDHWDLTLRIRYLANIWTYLLLEGDDDIRKGACLASIPAQTLPTMLYLCKIPKMGWNRSYLMQKDSLCEWRRARRFGPPLGTALSPAAACAARV
jgi:hypothetical protein